jgi:serine/threonine-protein kinase
MRIPLIIRLFLVMVLLVALALAAAVYVTLWQGRKLGEVEIERNLQRVETVRARYEEQVFQSLELRTNVISRDPDVAQYLDATTGDELGMVDAAPDPLDELGLGGDPTVATQTVPDPAIPAQQVLDFGGSMADLLKERKDQYGFDLGIVLDADGKVVARTDQADAVIESMADDALLKGVVETLEAAKEYWVQDGKLYQATAAPIVLDDRTVGFLLLADLVDDAVAEGFADVSSAEVSFLVGKASKLTLAASSLERDDRIILEGQLSERTAASEMMGAVASMKASEKLNLQLGRRLLVGNVDVINGGDGKPLGTVVTMTDADAGQAAFQTIQRWVLGTGVATLLLALLASYFFSRGLVKPLRKLAGAARQAANGDYTVHVEESGSDEVADLSHSFDQLLSSLREKQDMEGYVSELAKFLPESSGESSTPIVRAEPPQRSKGTLVAMDWKRFSHDVPAGQEGIFLTQIGALTQESEMLARVRGGRLLESAGQGAVLIFEGAESQLTAAQVLAQIMTRAAAGGVPPAAAMLDGEVVFGTVPNREPQTAVLGTAITQARRLLADAAPGIVLLAPQIARYAQGWIGRECSVANGAVSGKKFYALGPQDLAKLPAMSAPQVPAGAEDPNATRASAPTLPQNTPDTRNQTRLAPGSRFGGRFEIAGILGVGGMGMVYKARDIELDDMVALKTLRPGSMIDPGQLDRLKAELKIARKITHPNVVRTYDFGEVNNTPFISMEFVRGMTLRYLLTQSGKLPYSAALRLARQICAGLQAAHEVGVLHRDIKPENVILTPQGNAKLMDFGIARPLRKGEITSGEEGMFVGTPNYAAPEALSGEDTDARADIYSFGVMLTEMFCGKLPFKGSDTMEIYIAHLEKPPIKPSELWPEVPKPLETLILRCLAKKPVERFASAADLGQALGQLRT